ncbi:hypothetical protein HF1_03360 [Mycoplasma haemofelis str. Langford 1]|uniref:Uncharacterized protein n=1 Tax=Mycoplasma haemofelis (strain Langford 1) TaxID=941640 RepID=E8ZGS3_MYCHL|nr:hypothetical protein [Mycoplasma haemofelis]CBY92344.1 hypothetical protein HF1_03360 [Mycoplasma haemofelis str. Langford 1]
MLKSKLLLAPIAGVVATSIGAIFYAFQGSKDGKYRTKIPTYKKIYDQVKDHRKEKGDDGLYLVDPNNREWWIKRGKEFKKFYEGDWQDFRDKCFSEVKSKELDWHNILGESANYYSDAEYITGVGSVDFVTLCVEKEVKSS